MKVLLTNDDGIEAAGLANLKLALSALIPEEHCWIVAPHQPISGCSHQVTTGRPFRALARGERTFAVEGSPADCVRGALFKLAPAVDWVLSGINEGGNLGSDVYLSGTVAAVREAAMRGIPGIAISQYRAGGQPIDWEQAQRWTREILAELMEQPLPRGAFWNVNLPHLPAGSPLPERVYCPLCTQPLPLDYAVEAEGNGAESLWFRYQGRYAERARDPQTDTDICFSGRVAITQVQLAKDSVPLTRPGVSAGGGRSQVAGNGSQPLQP
ncbi:5'/3'-nucleotidase SurE [Synechococcus sp. R3-13]|uniref:5'/3'-nucleotidase SurE n=1 Tax=Synechococcus sp. R3-13 TaxID=2421316 RepID=UPI0039C4E51C